MDTRDMALRVFSYAQVVLMKKSTPRGALSQKQTQHWLLKLKQSIH